MEITGFPGTGKSYELQKIEKTVPSFSLLLASSYVKGITRRNPEDAEVSHGIAIEIARSMT